MPLTAMQLRHGLPSGKHYDAHGLLFLVTPAGGRYWRLKYRFAGKEKMLALGVYPAVSLSEARESATAARRQLAAGIDPGAARKAAKAQTVHDAQNTLHDVAARWLDHQQARWTAGTARRIWGALERHAFPELGALPLVQITPRDVQRMAQDVEATGAAEMAARVLQHVTSIYKWAALQGVIDTNAMAGLVPSDVLKPREPRHHLALKWDAMPAFMAALRAYSGDTIVAAALRWQILTATRPSEARLAQWSEIDLEAALWRIPAERMKARRPHTVPLARQAVQLARGLPRLSDTWLFPSPRYPAKPLSNMAALSALARLGYKGKTTAHGFRATFSTHANEAGKWRPEVIEAALAHTDTNAVRAAYARSTYLRERVKLAQWWADELAALDNTAHAVR